jgi:hypothetical protein
VLADVFDSIDWPAPGPSFLNFGALFRLFCCSLSPIANVFVEHRPFGMDLIANK